MTFEREPDGWQELQTLTAKVFEETGCTAEVEKTIETVRGKVEIDVFVEDPTHSPPLVILCECKYWSNPIPKTVVHAFRTVVADFGGNRGYVISKAGFQSGAWEAAENSNIELVDWQEFQALFYERWLQNMTERLHEPADVIFEYMDVLADRMAEINWTESKKAQHEDLFFRSSLYINANQWSEFGKKECIEFPLEISSPQGQPGQREKLVLNNYREYFDVAFSAAPSLLEEWKKFFGEA